MLYSNAINSNYFINELKTNNHNQNRFVYIDGFDGNVEIKENKLIFDLNFYIADNLHLPNNAFLTYISLPFVSLKDIPLNFSSQQTKPEYVNKKDSIDVYSTYFILDISKETYFVQQLIDHEFNIFFNFEINAEVINSMDIDSPQQNIDGLISEYTREKFSTSLIINNYEKIKNGISGHVFDAHDFYLNSFIQSTKSGFFIDYELRNHMLTCENPIDEIIIFKTKEQIVIDKCQLKFSYKIEGGETKELVCTEPQISFRKNEILIASGIKTFFNEEKQEVEKNNFGILGFYIPLNAVGQFQLDISFSNSIEHKNFSFINDFIFVKTDYKIDVATTVRQIYIDDSHGFHKEIF